MRNKSWLLFPFFCFFFLAARAQQTAGAAPATAQSTLRAAATAKPQTPEEFFARARQLSDLEAAGIPFHLKATYIASGNTEFTGNGTYEEWWFSPEKWRKEVTLEKFKYVSAKDAGKEVAYASSLYIPLRVRQAMMYVRVRIPADMGPTKSLKVEQVMAGATRLLEVEGKKPCSPYSKPDLSRKPDPLCGKQYEFTDEGVLRVQQDNPLTLVYNDIQPFQGHPIARKVDVAILRQLFLTISIILLDPLSSTDQTSFALTSDANLYPIFPIETKPTIKSSADAPKLIHSVDPIIPSEAIQNSKHKRLNAFSVVAASIDPEGKVREPYTVISAGNALDTASIQTVRQYRFAPIKRNGLPGTVTLFVTVEYH